MSEVYYPSEDSFLLVDFLEKILPKMILKNPGLHFLEIGSGSGIQLEAALKSGVKRKNIFSCDINISAVKRCKLLGFNCIKSNLFETFERKVKRRKPWFPRKYDVIVFNPPYLPRDSQEPKSSRFATTGGKNGSEITNRFLKDAKKFLKKNGKIFLVASNLTKGINFSGYRKKIAAKRKIFFEELYVLELY